MFPVGATLLFVGNFLPLTERRIKNLEIRVKTFSIKHKAFNLTQLSALLLLYRLRPYKYGEVK